VASVGERAALTQLIEQYQQPLGSYLLHLVGEVDVAVALTRETFVGALRPDPESKHREPFGRQLYRRATRLAYCYLRQQNECIQQAQQPRPASPVPAGCGTDERELVRAVLRDLDTNERAVLLLCELRGLPHDEVAAILEISTNMVSDYLTRARAGFRRAYVAHDSLI
jgi:RNA polymerase sigma factor (sigma-70 family)